MLLFSLGEFFIELEIKDKKQKTNIIQTLESYL